MRPRVRSGYALKRLDAEEGQRRWVLRDLSRDGFLRLSDRDAQLFELLDGSRSLVDLIGEAEQRFGGDGLRAARAAARRPRRARVPRGRREHGRRGRGAAPRSGAACSRRARRSSPGSAPRFESLYRHGAWVLFSRPALWCLAALCVAGIGVFGALIGLRYGTPFVVADKIGLGGLVFLLGRFAGRRGARDRARVDHGLVRAARREGGAQARGHPPLRLRRHERGVVRAAAAAHRRQRRRPRLRLLARRAVLALLPRAAGRHGARHLLPARLRGLRRRVLQPQPVHRARRVPHAGGLAARAGAAAAGARAVRPAARRPRAHERLAGARALLALGARLDRAGRLLRGRDVAPLPARS